MGIPFSYFLKQMNTHNGRPHVLVMSNFLIITLIMISGCAAFDKSRQSWHEFSESPKADQIKLHYKTLGSGKPVIMIHGFAANTYTWRHLVPALAKKHKVYMLDLKGFGESPKPDDGAYSIYDQARLVIDMIKQQKLRDISLVGHSYGGGVALVTALFLIKNMPDTLVKLVLIDSVAYAQDTPFFINVLATPLLGKVVANIVPASSQVAYVLNKLYYNDDLITTESIEAYAKQLQSCEGVNALLNTARQILPADLNQLSMEYHKIKVPTKIIWGEYDEIVPLSVGKRLHQAIDSSSIDIIASCGHIPHEECPAETIPIIIDFL